jgi:hypothetical protein
MTNDAESDSFRSGRLLLILDLSANFARPWPRHSRQGLQAVAPEDVRLGSNSLVSHISMACYT